MGIPTQYSTIVSTLPGGEEERRAIQLILDAIQASAGTTGGSVSLQGSNSANAVEIFTAPNLIAGLVAGPNCIITADTANNAIIIDALGANTNGYQQQLLQSLQPGSSPIFDGTRTLYSINSSDVIQISQNDPLHLLTIGTVVANTRIPYGSAAAKLTTSAGFYYTGADLFVNGIRVLGNAQANSVVNYANYANTSAYANYSNFSGLAANANVANYSNFSGLAANANVANYANFSNYSDYSNSAAYSNSSNYANVSNSTNTLNPDGNVLTTKFAELNISGNIINGYVTVDWGLSDAQVIQLTNYRSGDPAFGNVVNISFTNSQTTTKMLRIIHPTGVVNINVIVNGYSLANVEVPVRFPGIPAGASTAIFCPYGNLEQKQTLVSVYSTNYGYFLSPVPYWN